MSFKIMARRCDQCLLDPENRIVSDRRAASLIRECISQDIPFYCHKATIAGQKVACRGLHDTAPCRNARMAEWLGLQFREFDPETMQQVVPPLSPEAVRESSRDTAKTSNLNTHKESER